jgi:hypothetical protein
MAEARWALRALLYAGGSVATAAGLHTAVAGARSIAGEGQASATIESELRFYGAIYAAYGVTVLRVARRADEDPDGVRAVAGALFAAGLARAAAWRAVGRPHPFQRLLLAIELVLPPVLVARQANLAKP